MGVSNVTTKQQIVQLALKKKGSAQVRQNPQLVYLSKNGSIFNAPGVKTTTSATTTTTRATIQDLNTKQSIEDLNKPAVSATSATSSKSQGSDDGESGDVSLGSVKSATTQTKSLTTSVKADAKTASSLGASGAKLEKSITTGNKSYGAKVKTQQAELEKENARLAKIIQQTEETQTLVTNAQNELDSLTSGGTVSSSNKARVGELQTYIGSKVGLLQQNGKSIYSLQRSQSRILARMNRLNASYIRTQNANTKSIETQQDQTNKVAETATKIEEISAATQAGGQALALLGEAMMSAGSLWAPLLTLGAVFVKVGNFAEMIGQYGQAAAGITKTAAYAADGNLCAAMMSAASATQAGMSAAKSTANWSKTVDAINERAEAKIQDITAKSAAKEQVAQMVQDGTITKAESKQMREAIQANIRQDMVDGKITTSGTWGNVQVKNYKEQINGQTSWGTGVKDASGNEIMKTGTYAEKAADKAQQTYNEAMKKVGQNNNLIDEKGNYVAEFGDKYATVKDADGNITKKVKISKLDKQLKTSFKAKIAKQNEKFTNPMANFGDTLSKLGTSATNIAAVFMQNEAIKGSTQSQKKQLQQFQLDARTRKIMQKNQRYRQHAAFV